MEAFMNVADPQASGWRDDGTESGLIRVAGVRGNLVQMPFKYGAVNLTANGSASISLIGQVALQDQGGVGTYVSATVQASASLANSAVIGFWINGNVFGLRFLATTNPIGCMIDGVAYSVPTVANTNPATGASVSIAPHVNGVIIADDLGDGKHWVELTFPAFLSGSNRSYNIYGFIVDAASGNEKPRHNFVSAHHAAIRITATTGSGGHSFGNQMQGVWGIRKIHFFNTSGSDCKVYAVYSTATSQVIWAKKVVAGLMEEFDLGGVLADYSNVKFYAETTNVIDMIAIGAV